MKKDLDDWARHSGIAISFPPKVFPVNSVKAMRGCIWLAPQGKLIAFADAVFKAYWSDNRDISQDEVLAPYVDRYLQALEGFWSSQSPVLAASLTLHLFPSTLVQDDVLARVADVLSRPELPAGQRRVLSEQHDDLLRARRAQRAG